LSDDVDSYKSDMKKLNIKNISSHICVGNKMMKIDYNRDYKVYLKKSLRSPMLLMP